MDNLFKKYNVEILALALFPLAGAAFIWMACTYANHLIGG